MSAHAALSVASEVERMLQAGRNFEQVETFIEHQPVTEEQKAALWLLAWAEADGTTRRQLITPLLTA